MSDSSVDSLYANRLDQRRYVPPFPRRPSKEASIFSVVWAARKNLIGLWPDETFDLENFSYKLLRRRILFLTMPDAVKQVFVDGGPAYETKTHQLRHALAPLVGDGLFISDGETWRKRRRLMAPITHVSRLPQLSLAITAGVTDLRRDWLARVGGEVDVIAAAAELAVDIIVRGVFGHSLKKDSTKRLVAAFGTYRKLVDQTDILSLLDLSPRIPRVRGLRTRLAARGIHKVLNPLIDEALRISPEDRPDDLSMMRSMAVDADGLGARLTKTELRNEAAVMILAGHEGAGNTLAWALFLISQDPETERRLHAEVDGVLGEDPAGFDDFAKLPFTRAIIEETLRLYPPIPFQGRIATQDGMVGTRPVKAGDLVILNAWIMHRHRKLWTDPDVFDPDRFMPSGSGIPSRYAFVPFSIGPRICTGAALALLETVLCLATIARSMRLRLRPNWTVTPDCRLSLRPGTRLPMIIECRHDVAPSARGAGIGP